MINCKRCHAEEIIKNGLVRNQIRYRCKKCGLNFIEGDRRVKDSVAVKKALAVILYSLGKASFGMLAKIFGHSRSLTYRWISEEAAKHNEPAISGDIKEIEFDEMWHFIQSKKTKDGSSRRWIVAQGELLPGLSAIVMLQSSNDSTAKLSI
ncbi:MAG: IS1 family transposase [Proteobacteria bacterium]|nr:IS1 family transposase [Pseudomonadota bacterium]